MSSVQEFVSKVFDGKSEVPLSELVDALSAELQTGKVHLKLMTSRQPKAADETETAIVVEWVDKESKA